MSRGARRRRAVLLLALAAASGGLAASQVRSSVQRVEARVGPGVPVVAAREDLRAGTKLDADALARYLEVREVPELYVPPDSLASPEDAAGLRTATPVAAGGYLTAAHLESGAEGREAGPALAPGERVVELAVVGGEPLAGAGPGVAVDVLVTTESRTGSGRTYVALEGVELLDARVGGEALEAGGEGGAMGDTLALLRVTAEQAVFLTSAQNFAREIRLLARSPEDRKHVGPASVSGSEL